jgi:hypothetical protein
VKSWGMGTREGTIKVRFEKLDFRLLGAQKHVLVKLQSRLSKGSTDQERIDAERIEGLVQMIDFIQDEAEKTLGKEVVYGSILRTMPMPSYDEALRRSMNKNTHGR